MTDDRPSRGIGRLLIVVCVLLVAGCVSRSGLN
jgi:hypothetical protein